MRNLGLDLLRFLAVLLVVGRHMYIPKDAGFILRAWKTGGWVGVDLFFVLSGFLVSGLLFREQKRNHSLNVTRFLIRRGFKIYPAFWFMLAFTLLVWNRTETKIPPQGLFGELFFLQNYLGSLWNHTWSLAVEEHFYLAIALLFGIASSRKCHNPFAWVPTAFALIGTACLILRIATQWWVPDHSFAACVQPTHLRVDALFFGVLLSYWTHHADLEVRLRAVPSLVLVALGAALLAPAFIFPLENERWIVVFGVILFYLGAGCWLMAGVRLRASRSRLLGFFGALGATSYSIYLWHMPVNVWGTTSVAQYLGLRSFGAYFSLYIIGTFGVGYLLSRLIEWPTLGMRDRLFPSLAKPRIAGLAARPVPVATRLAP